MRLIAVLDGLPETPKQFSTASFKINKIFLCLFFICCFFFYGCATYYGHTGKYEENIVSQKLQKYNVRHFACLNFQEDSIELSCFRKYDLRTIQTIKRKMVARIDYYRKFDGNSFVNSGKIDFWKNWKNVGSLTKNSTEHYSKHPLQSSNNNLIQNCVVLVGACCRVAILACCATLDMGFYAGNLMYSLVILPSYWYGGKVVGWLGGRLFCWGKDWHLKENKPSAVRMISYMPFINLFFPFQTPPYMTNGPDHTEVHEINPAVAVAAYSRISTVAQQERCLSYPVTVDVFSGRKKLGSGKFLTDNNRGSVQLCEFLRDSIRNNSFPIRDLSINITLCDRSGEKVLLKRKCNLSYDWLITRSAREDLLSYNSAEIDCLNKVLLRYRSHRMWQKEFWGDDFKSLQQQFKNLHSK